MSDIIDHDYEARQLVIIARDPHHRYVGDAERAVLSSAAKALFNAHEYRWKHINDELPPMDEWVLCAGYAQRETGEIYEWSGCGKRKSRNGGAWTWLFDDEDFDGSDLEFWCNIRDLPPARLFKPKTPEITE